MKLKAFLSFSLLGIFASGLLGCAEVSVPDARNVKIPSPVTAEKRRPAVNERPDSVMYLPLGDDVLVPGRIAGEALPKEIVGPFEMRGETLAGALQLILAEYDISIAFESDKGMSKKITVTNLKGELGKLVKQVCSLADLYCSYEDGTLLVKDTQIFTVTLPPLADAEGGDDFIEDVIQGLSAVIGKSGTAPVSDPTTRTLIYSATQRTAQLAENYFQRLRANTAMIVFETYIWEVSLDANNSTGIDWDLAHKFGKFDASIGVNGSVGAGFTNPISIGLPQTVGASPADMLQFLSQFGAVKTISQPQITVLSGASAELRVADTQNYVSEVTSTVSGDQTTTSVSTDSVDSGFTLTIGSSWDRSTVYSNISISLTNVVTIDDFTFSDSGAGGTDTIIQLPQTTERELTTQVRVRPGDSLLIAGLVRETDNFDTRGPGFMEPVIPDSRTVRTQNLELVVMMRPRVIVYTAADDVRNQGAVNKEPVRAFVSPKVREEWTKSDVRQSPASLVRPSLFSSSASSVSAPSAPAPIRPALAVVPVQPPVVSAPVLPPVPKTSSDVVSLPFAPSAQEVAPREVGGVPIPPALPASKQILMESSFSNSASDRYVPNSYASRSSRYVSPAEPSSSSAPALVPESSLLPKNLEKAPNVYEQYEASKESVYVP